MEYEGKLRDEQAKLGILYSSLEYDNERRRAQSVSVCNESQLDEIKKSLPASKL